MNIWLVSLDLTFSQPFLLIFQSCPALMTLLTLLAVLRLGAAQSRPGAVLWLRVAQSGSGAAAYRQPVVAAAMRTHN